MLEILSWNGQDTSRFGTAYIRRREASGKQQRLEIRERGERERTLESVRERVREEETRAVYEPVSSTVTAIAILNHLEFVVYPSRSTVRLCETPGTFIAVIRATALP